MLNIAYLVKKFTSAQTPVLAQFHAKKGSSTHRLAGDRRSQRGRGGLRELEQRLWIHAEQQRRNDRRHHRDGQSGLFCLRSGGLFFSIM